MSSAIFNMKLNADDQVLINALMAKHKVKERAALMRRALAYFESAPVIVDPVLDAISRLERFIPTEAELNRHREAKQRIDAGQGGLDKAESLTLLDSLQSGDRAKAKAQKK